MNDENGINPTDLEQELADMTSIAKRAMADLANYKKQVEDERAQLMGFGKISVLTEILPVIDNFNRAFGNAPEETEWTKGIHNIYRQLENIAVNAGLTPIESVGKPVDPNLHEIVTAAPGEKDIIVQEIERGYTYNGKVIRASKVIVGQG